MSRVILWLGMFGIGVPELVIISIIVLVLFGGKKLPELSRGIGQSIREIRKGLKGDDEDKSTAKKSEKTKKS